MRHQDIIDRLNDVAAELESDRPNTRRAASFLRSTATRIADDDELATKIGQIKLQHEIKKCMREAKDATINGHNGHA